MQTSSLAEQSGAFLLFLEDWMHSLPVVDWENVIEDSGRTAILSIDVTNGFCYEGPLSSPRVAKIVEPITRLFEGAWRRGVRKIVLSQDTHEPEAVEFNQWPPHCVRGTSEAEAVNEFKMLPFFNEMTVLEKNSIHPGLNTGLNAWLEDHPEVDTFITTGDCTDLCTYQLAMHLRLDANARQLHRRVIVPANCVNTYDRTVETAREQGGLPHPGELMHALFLYHMQLNGMEVVAEIA